MLAAVVAAPFLGSFLGMLAVSLPSGGKIVPGRSRCNACGHPHRFFGLLPILGWFIQRGRCGNCGEAIAWERLACEAGMLAVMLWAAFLAPAAAVLPTTLLAALLVLIAVIDARHRMIPNSLNLILAIAGLAVTAWLTPYGLPFRLAAMVLGVAIILLLYFLYLWLRGREGIGMGDAKFMGAAGAWIGIKGLPSVLLLGACSGLLAVAIYALIGGKLRGDLRMAFGPFLALGLWVTWLYGPITL